VAGNEIRRFGEVLDLLPADLVHDGKIVMLDDAGAPFVNKLMFGHRRPTHVAFDLLIADGVDLRPLPLNDLRNSSLHAQIVELKAAPFRTKPDHSVRVRCCLNRSQRPSIE